MQAANEGLRARASSATPRLLKQRRLAAPTVLVPVPVLVPVLVLVPVQVLVLGAT
jgi:hypothetical protein